MISQKTKYALKALMTLADAETAQAGGSLTIEEIARRSGTPKRFLEHILLELRNAGYIASRRGRAGGYVLIKAPKAISLGDLLRRIDGPIAPLPCLSRHAYQRCEDCADETTCRLREVFGQVFWSYLLLIESLTLSDLVTPEPVRERIVPRTAAVGE
jgi:Rrf2 family protein